MLDVLIEIVAAIADVFVDSWINRVISRFAKKHKNNIQKERKPV